MMVVGTYRRRASQAEKTADKHLKVGIYWVGQKVPLVFK